MTYQSRPNASDPKGLSWTAADYPEYQRHPMWFLGFGLAVSALILYGVYSKSWSMAAAFALFGIMGGLHATRKPRNVNIRLTGTGVEVDGQQYSYQVIRKFWILYSPPDIKALYLETTAYLNHTIRIELGGQDPRPIHDYLSRFLKEDLDRRESLTEAIARKLKF